MANWCRYCTGNYPYYCALSGERISNDYFCKNDGYKCPIYDKYAPYYVTCTTCLILDKDENDKVYSNIRSLKDNYMAKDEKYSEDIANYDLIGRYLSVMMAQDRNKVKVAEKVYSVLEKISTYVEQEKIDEAVNNYKKMVTILMKKYNLNELYEKKSKKQGIMVKTLAL